MPFLRSEVIQRMAERLSGCDILAVEMEGWPQPLHAFYSRGCLPYARDLLDKGVTSPRSLFSRCRVRRVPATDFLDIDPDLLSFKDVNTMEDYQAARQQLQGFQPEVAL